MMLCVDADTSEVSEAEDNPLNVLERGDCPRGEVECEDESSCIASTFQCDRFFDCADRGDESLECGK